MIHQNYNMIVLLLIDNNHIINQFIITYIIRGPTPGMQFLNGFLIKIFIKYNRRNTVS